MKLVFLGTASCFPTPSRGVSCTALQLDDGNVWLFDCGEGSQIQLQKSSIKPGKINKIFITHLHGDHLFGLPGLLCTLGNGMNPEKSKEVVTLYGPHGIRKFVQTVLGLSRSPLAFKLAVVELFPRPDMYPDNWEDWKIQHRMEESPLPQESSYEKISYDETIHGWKLITEGHFEVHAVSLKHRIPSFGFIVSEKESPGKLNTQKLIDIGVRPGPIFGKLKNGLKVVLENGECLDPSNFVGPNIPGRKVAIMGDTCDSSELLFLGLDLDVLVHEATMENSLEEKCVEFGHSTPNMAVDVAVSCKTKTLVLFHLSPRYKPLSICHQDSEDMQSAQILIDEATSRLQKKGRSDMNILVAEDFYELEIPKNKSAPS